MVWNIYKAKKIEYRKQNRREDNCPLNLRVEITMTNTMFRRWIMPTLRVQGLWFMYGFV